MTPAAVERMHALALEHGWVADVRHADGPPESWVLRIRRPDARWHPRAYGAWWARAEGPRWHGGATSACMPLRGVGALRSFIVGESA